MDVVEMAREMGGYVSCAASAFSIEPEDRASREQVCHPAENRGEAESMRFSGHGAGRSPKPKVLIDKGCGAGLPSDCTFGPSMAVLL